MSFAVTRRSRQHIVVAASAVVGLALVATVGLGLFNSPAPVRGLQANGPVTDLPLGLDVYQATQVITVVASSTTAATAALQPWQRRGNGWVRMGPEVTAHVAEDGLTAAPHEFEPATPLGSYSLTQAFGKLADPGTKLPYFQATSADWWISQPGPLYNTHQFCTVGCAFTQADPNARLTAQIRAYNYAVVIDYNRFPVVQDAGSAYFLHVTTAGKPTKGCISMPQPALISILQWLDPKDHPRILIGIA